MNIEKILIIKLRHLGDVLLSTPVFSSLQSAFPDAQIDAYIWKEAAPMLQGHPAVAKLHLYDRKWKELSLLKRVPKELSLLRAIRSEKYDLVVNLTEGDRGAHVAMISGAKTRVGFVPKKKHMRRAFTHLVKHCPNPRHTVERDLDAVRILGIHPKWDERDLTFAVSEEHRKKAEELVGEGPYVVIHAPSRWRFKCLPQALMAKVIDLLDARVVLTGAPSEREYVQGIVDQTEKEVLNLAGLTSLKEMGAVFQGSRGLITVDSVSLHIASALKVPTVALFGPTSEKNWGPWRNPHAKVVAQARECRPCRLDGCGGSKMSDCLYTLSPKAIADAFHCVASAETGVGMISVSSLLALNSFEI